MSIRPVILAVAVMVFFASCGKKSGDDTVHNRSKTAHTLLEQEAKYADVPVPVGYTCTKSAHDHANSSQYFSYHGGLTLDQALVYYRHTMELLGWDIEDHSNEYEGLLLCRKRSRQCNLFIRGNAPITGSSVSVFVKEKDIPIHELSDDINAKEFYLA